MKTSTPFSTISYNSADFLQVKLDDLVSRRVLAFYAFVYHYREEDERKDHIHLICFPNGQYQTDSLATYLQEPDPSNPLGKPLGIMPCKSSKWADWYLYCSHDVAYLATKMQTRKYHYVEADFRTSEPDYLHELIHTIDRSKYVKTQDFVKAVGEGRTLFDMVTSGQIPAPQFLQWSKMYDFIKENTVYRDDRESHTPLIDKDTGELIE